MLYKNDVNELLGTKIKHNIPTNTVMKYEHSWAKRSLLDILRDVLVVTWIYLWI